ncbi:MAG: integrase [Candidatus Azotimanducaceae bacterium]|jgi:integrase
MRQGEILNLTWNLVDLKRRGITLEKTKNGERRHIPLVNHAWELLNNLSKIRRMNTALVFHSRTTPLSPVAIRKPWGNAVKSAELQDLKFHDLRHTAASYLAMSGASHIEISEVLDHKTLQMVKRYAHLSQSHTSSILERIFGASSND